MATTRGTTPIHTFNVDADLTEAEVVYLTYKQGSKVVLEKTNDELEITAEAISFKLTQEETLAFKTTQNVEVQIRARFADGTAIASNVITASISKILKEGEI